VTTPVDLVEHISSPGNVQASDGNSNEYIQVTWDSVVEATYHEVYVSTDDDDSTAGPPGTVQSNSYEDYYADGGTFYYYWIKACDESHECSGYSSSDSGHIDLDPPTSVEATTGTSTYEIEVTWNTSSHAADPAVEVWRYNDDISDNAELLDTVYGTLYSDQIANPGKYYHYWLKACGDDFCSEFSYPDDGYMDVEAATGVSASDGIYTDKVEVTWDFVTSADDFELYRHTII
jgi:fibronectin type 3 domain-containing protein